MMDADTRALQQRVIKAGAELRQRELAAGWPFMLGEEGLPAGQFYLKFPDGRTAIAHYPRIRMPYSVVRWLSGEENWYLREHLEMELLDQNRKSEPITSHPVIPKIYEYFGIVFLIYTDDHEPVHVHAQYGNAENKIELYYSEGQLTDVVFQRVRGKAELPAAQKRKTEDFVRQYHEGIVSKWNDVQVFKRKPSFEKITKKTK